MAIYSIMIITNHDCPDYKPLKSLALTFQEWVLSFDQEGQPHKDYVIALTCAFSKDLENKSTPLTSLKSIVLSSKIMRAKCIFKVMQWKKFLHQ